MLAVGGDDRKAVIYDADTYKEIQTIERNRNVKTVSFSPNDSRVVVGCFDDSTASIYDTS